MSYLAEWLFGASRAIQMALWGLPGYPSDLLVPPGCRCGLSVTPGCIPSSQNPALPWQIIGVTRRLLEASGLRPGRAQPCLGRLLESPGFALADYWFRGKGVNPAIDFIMNLTIFWRAWKLDFWPLPGVYPPGLTLADYWSDLLGVYPPWPWVYLSSLALGLPF